MLFRPSELDRVAECPASINAIQELMDAGLVPAHEETIHTYTGTVAHKIVADCLFEDRFAREFLNTEHVSSIDPSIKVTVDKAMVDHCQQFVNYCLSYLSPDQFIERTIKHSTLPYQGTPDFACVTGDRLIVRDFKYGKGHKVSVDTWQLLAYAELLLDYLKLNTDFIISYVDVGIYQPRIGHFPTKVYTPSAVSALLRDVVSRIRNGIDNNVFGPSDIACNWCPVAKLGCEHRIKQLTSAVFTNYDELEVKPVKNIVSNIELEHVVKAVRSLTRYKKDLEELCLNKLLSGETVGNFILGETDTHRQYKDPQDVLNLLAETDLDIDEYAPRSLVGPGALLKILKANESELNINPYITKPPGNPKLTEK